MAQKHLDTLKIHEGFSAVPYKCTADKNTIGYGYNMDANPLKVNVARLKQNGITKEAAERLLMLLCEKIKAELETHFSWFDALDEDRQWVLINMAYNMGTSGLYKFKNMLTAVGKGDYDKAAAEMKNSKWYSQVGNRSAYLKTVMETANA